MMVVGCCGVGKLEEASKVKLLTAALVWSKYLKYIRRRSQKCAQVDEFLRNRFKLVMADLAHRPLL
jgi:hypothetical protein